VIIRRVPIDFYCYFDAVLMVKALSNLPKCSSVQYFNYFISVDEVVSNDNFVIAIICVKSVIDLSRKQY